MTPTQVQNRFLDVTSQEYWTPASMLWSSPHVRPCKPITGPLGKYFFSALMLTFILAASSVIAFSSNLQRHLDSERYFHVVSLCS